MCMLQSDSLLWGITQIKNKKVARRYDLGRIISIIVFTKIPLWFDVNELW